MNWIIITALLIVVFFVVFKYKEARSRIGLLTALIVILIVGVSFWWVYSSHNLTLNSFDDFVETGKVYFSWLGGIFGNAKTLTTYAIRQNWSMDSKIGEVNKTGSVGGK